MIRPKYSDTLLSPHDGRPSTFSLELVVFVFPKQTAFWLTFTDTVVGVVSIPPHKTFQSVFLPQGRRIAGVFLIQQDKHIARTNFRECNPNVSIRA